MWRQIDWSQINLSLYAICSTGKAKRSERYDRCLSTTHKADDCSLTSEADPDVAKRLKVESAVVALIHLTSAGPTRSRDCECSGETCHNSNRNRCSFPGCRFTQQCGNCKGCHSRFECPLRNLNTTPVGPTCRTTQPPGHRSDLTY